jgi:hypothetical protein
MDRPRPSGALPASPTSASLNPPASSPYFTLPAAVASKLLLRRHALPRASSAAEHASAPCPTLAGAPARPPPGMAGKGQSIRVCSSRTRFRPIPTTSSYWSLLSPRSLVHHHVVALVAAQSFLCLAMVLPCGIQLPSFSTVDCSTSIAPPPICTHHAISYPKATPAYIYT